MTEAILHVITKSEWGGAQRIVDIVTAGSRFQAGVACAPGGRLVSKLTERDVPVHRIQSLVRKPRLSKDVRAVAELVRTIRQHQYGMIHCHSTKAGALGRIAGAVTGTPTVFTVHGWGFYNTEYGKLAPMIRIAERGLGAMTSQIVCVSENDLRVGRDAGILASGEGVVIHNGIPPLTTRGHSTLRDDGPVSPESMILGSVGRLAEQKNPQAVLRLGRELRHRGYDVETVLVGDGPLRDECERIAERAPERSHVLGFCDDAVGLLDQFDMLALPSRFEGLPLTVLEAMHLGVPVVAYDVGGVAEAVTHRETGMLAQEGDFEDLAGQAEHLARDQGFRESLGKAATERAQSYFVASRMVEEYDEIYSNYLS